MPLTISVDAIDFAGKTTQIELLKNKMEELGLKVLVTKAIGSDLHPATKKLRDIALSSEYELSAQALQMIFATNALIHRQEVIEKIGKDYDIILIDRSYLSFYAYGLPLIPDATWLSLVSDFIAMNKPQDVIIYLDIDPDVAIQRAKGRNPENFESGGIDKMEAMGSDYQKQVQAVFHQMISTGNYNVVPIDVNKTSIEETHKAILDSKAWEMITQYSTYVKTKTHMEKTPE